MGGDLQIVNVTLHNDCSCFSAMAVASPLDYHQQEHNGTLHNDCSCFMCNGCCLSATLPPAGTQDNVQQWNKTAWNDLSGGLKVLQVKQL